MNKSFARQVAGWVLIVAGVATLFIPFTPAILCLGAGALLLSPYIPAFRRLSIYLRRRFPKLRKHLKIFGMN